MGGEKKVTIHGEEIAVKARIENIDSFSAHADQKGLLNRLRCGGIPAKGIILTHGEEEAQTVLATEIIELTGFTALIPAAGETFEWIGNVIGRTGKDTAKETVPPELNSPQKEQNIVPDRLYEAVKAFNK